MTLAFGGTRGYTWDDAGNLEQVAAGANVIDFTADAAGRMSATDRTAAGATAAFAYDGRSFLRRAEQAAGGTQSVEPVYDAAGRVHALRRKASATANEELVLFLDFAGRPVAQLAIDGTSAETWTYLTTDHLGTPLLATDATGTVTWEGGFEPFGTDWQQGPPQERSKTGSTSASPDSGTKAPGRTRPPGRGCTTTCGGGTGLLPAGTQGRIHPPRNSRRRKPASGYAAERTGCVLPRDAPGG